MDAPSNVAFPLVIDFAVIKALPVPSAAEIILCLLVCSFFAAFKSQGVLWDLPDPNGFVFFERPQLKDGKPQQLHAQSSKQRDIAVLAESQNSDIVVFWGSQSGTAESLAHRLSQSLRLRFGLSVFTADLGDHEPASIARLPSSKTAIFIVATYGEGGPSDNAIEFWDWIHKDHAAGELSNLKYMALGLGSSNYRQYNHVVNTIDSVFRQSGASSLHPAARADDATGSTEEDYLAWTDNVFTTIQTHFSVIPRPATYSPTITTADAEASSSSVDLVTNVLAKRTVSRTSASPPSTIRHLPIVASEDIFRRPNERICLDMQLDLTEHPELRYKTGDHLVLWPQNHVAEVRSLMRSLDREHQSNDGISIQCVEAGERGLRNFTSPTTLEILFMHQLDICRPVPRNTVLELAQFAPSEAARTLLADLGRSREAYAQFCSRRYMTLARLLEYAGQGAKWSALPLSYLIENVPALQPRYYSISSSSVVSPRHLSITVIVQNQRSFGSVSSSEEGLEAAAPGLTTNYLLDLSNSSALVSGQVHATINRTTFKPPISSSTPMIMIANGTGIAPFRAFIAERTKLHEIGKRVGPMMLFYGCRNAETDWLYREEIKTHEASLRRRRIGPDGEVDGDGEELLRLRSAISRSAAPDKSSVQGYVQDAVQGEVSNIVQWLEEHGASLYVCGGAKMARQVGQTIADAYTTLRVVSDVESAAWIDALKKKGKWKEDVWE